MKTEILSLQYLNTHELKPWNMNPRKNDHAISAVATSINNFGFNIPIICDDTFRIIAGHTRWKAAMSLNMEKVPVIIVKLDDLQKKAFSITDNKTAELADWDFPKLREILIQIQEEDFDIKSMGFNDNEIRSLLGDDGEDSLPEDVLTTKIKTGDVISVGDHRLVCGDASNVDTFDLLLKGQTIQAVITSPPRWNQRGMGHWANIHGHCRDIGIAASCSVNSMIPGGIVFWNVGSSSATHDNLPRLHAELLESARLEYLDTIAWVRPGANFTTKRSAHIVKNRYYYPAHQWEPILVYRKPGHMPRMTVEASRYMADFSTDVWEVGAVTSSRASRCHPAVGPVEIPYRGILAYTNAGDAVLDPFAGSGTTMIAAEKTNRRAFLIEKNPLYCEVIVRRWERFQLEFSTAKEKYK